MSSSRPACQLILICLSRVFLNAFQFVFLKLVILAVLVLVDIDVISKYIGLWWELSSCRLRTPVMLNTFLLWDLLLMRSTHSRESVCVRLDTMYLTCQHWLRIVLSYHWGCFCYSSSWCALPSGPPTSNTFLETLIDPRISVGVNCFVGSGVTIEPRNKSMICYETFSFRCSFLVFY